MPVLLELLFSVLRPTDDAQSSKLALLLKYGPTISYSFLFFMALMVLIWKSPLWKEVRQKRFLVVNHFTSLVFSCIYLSLVLSYHSPWPSSYTTGLSLTSPYDRLICAITTGHYIYDLACVVGYGTVTGRYDTSIIIHHISAALGLTAVIVTPHDGYFMIQGTLLAETSNPFYNMYRMLQYANAPPSAFDLVNKLLFAATYFIFRVLVGGHLIWVCIRDRRMWFCIMSGGLTWLLSVFWFSQILSWVRKQVQKYDDSKNL